MQTLKQNLLSFGKTELNTIMVAVFLFLLSLSTFLIGLNGWIFLVFLICCLPFIWLAPQAGILAALFITMIFGDHFSLMPLKLEDTIYKVYAIDFVLVLSFIIWFFKQEIGGVKIKNIASKKNNWLFVFFVLIVLNLIRSLLITNVDMSLALATFKNYSYLLLYFIILFMFPTQKDILRLVKILIWAGLPLLFFVIFGLLSGHGLWSELTPGQRYLSGLHSYYLTFSLVALLFFISSGSYLWGRIKTLLVFLLQLAGLIGGMFRHLWLGVLVAFSYLFFMMKVGHKKRIFKISGASLFLIIAIITAFLWGTGTFGAETNFLESKFITSVTGRITSLYQTGYLIESAAGWRLETWQVALHKFLENPFFGIAFGQKFFFEYRGFVDLVDIRNIHNDFMSLLVQLGIFGFLPFLIFSFLQFKDLKKVIKKGGAATKALANIFMAWWLVAAFGVFFALYLMFNGTSIFYWTLMAMISILVKNEKLKVKK